MILSSYLYEVIKERIEQNPGDDIFKILDSKGYIKSLDNNSILGKLDYYSKFLEKFFGKICIVYNEFNEDFVAFIIAAFKNNVKLLIRRTTIDLKNEIEKDLNNMKNVLPIDLYFSNEKLYEVKSDMFTDNSITCEYNFIQLSSGTTQSSKAFCLSIDSLIKSAKHIEKVQHVNKSSLIFSYLTFTHIYGFVSGFILPIITGAVGIFCNTNFVKNDVSLIFKILSSEKITHISLIANSLLEGLHNSNTDIELSSLVCASLGGEKIDYVIFNKIKNGMIKLGMSKNALVNSYGMSEKGSITMEDPLRGNYILKKDNRIYISAGDNIFEDTRVITINDNYDVLNDDIIGMIAVSSV